jgi:hypothetical protein
LSYWGYPRCKTDKDGDLVPAVFGSVPDVIIQFSWRNSKKYETKAIDDMMTKALESRFGAVSTARPTLGYLFKVKFANEAAPTIKRQTPTPKIQGTMGGLHIYRLPHDTRTAADALSNTTNNGGASVHYYEPGGPEDDCLITIIPADLRITGFWQSWRCGNYTLKASDVFARLS